MENNNFDKGQNTNIQIRFLPSEPENNYNLNPYYHPNNKKLDDPLFDLLKQQRIVTTSQKVIIPVYDTADSQCKYWKISTETKNKIIDQMISLNIKSKKWYNKLFNKIKNFIFKKLKLKNNNCHKIYITKNRRGIC